MQKIVVSKTYHGFGLTDEMIDYIGYKKKHKNDRGWEVSRTDPKLVEYLETTPEEKHGGLGVCYVPDGVKWDIEDYDSREWVAEVHRKWYAK